MPYIVNQLLRINYKFQLDFFLGDKFELLADFEEEAG